MYEEEILLEIIDPLSESSTTYTVDPTLISSSVDIVVCGPTSNSTTSSTTSNILVPNSKEIEKKTIL